MKTAFHILVTAIALFIWGFVSWTVFPWHKNYQSFTNEIAVGEVLKQNAPSPGVYMLPGHVDGTGKHRDDVASAMLSAAGPFMQGMVRPGSGDPNMSILMVRSFGIQLLTAILLYLILRHTGIHMIRQAIPICLLCGVFAFVIGWLPAVNWFEYPLTQVLPYLGDHIVSGLIAGSILGRSLWR